MNDVAGVHKTKTHPARDRRGDIRINDLQLRVIHSRRSLLNRPLKLFNRGRLRIYLLLRNRVLLDQALIALKVSAGVVQIRSVTRQRPFRLMKLDFEGPWIDYRDDISLSDEFAFLIVHLHQLAVDAGFDRHRVIRRHRPKTVVVDGHAAHTRRLRAHGRWTERAAAAAPPTATTATSPAVVLDDLSRLPRLVHGIGGYGRNQS